MGDDIYDKVDLKLLAESDDREHFKNKMLIFESNEKIGGKILIDKDDNFIGIEEFKGKIEESTDKENIKNHIDGNFINTGAYFLEAKVLDFEPILVKEGEYGLPQTLLAETLSDKNFKVKCQKAKKWINITNEESLKSAENTL
jgi:NDP-sugar pyrophosphorylase family protein